MEQVIAADEFAPDPDGPGRRRYVDGQIFLNLVDDLEGIAAFAVHLVAKRQDRQIAHPADFEQFLRLAFHTLCAVDHHHGGVHGSQCAIGILGKIRVARRVHQIEPEFPILARKIERHRRSADRNAAILLHLHEIRPRAPRLALGPNLTGHLDRTAVQQELLGQRRLPRVGVRDDREGPATADFRRKRGAVGNLGVWHLRDIGGPGARRNRALRRQDVWGWGASVLP